jgi:hypothetical protein
MKNTVLLTMLAGIVTASAGVQPAPPVVIKGQDPCAGPISYNNAELLYAYTDYDLGSDSGDGVILRLEYSAWENFYITGGAAYHEAAEIDLWSLSAGVGGYVPLTQNIHLVGEAGVLWTTWDGPDVWVPDGSADPNAGYWDAAEDDEFGWYVRPHFRAKWGCFEAHAGAVYSDYGGEFEDEWAGFVKLYYQVSPGWDITAGVTFGEDTTMVTGGARYRY